MNVIKDEQGNPWWVAKEVCAVLDDDEKAEVPIKHLSSNGVEQNRNYIVINESGLYSLILRSRKPAAKQFKRWITHEV